METYLLATDADEVYDEVDAALATQEVRIVRVRRGRDVRPAILEHNPAIVILDLQIGNMGGVATCLDLRLEESGGRLGRVAVLMLLDRAADVFIARRSGSDGWLIKPLDAVRLRKATVALRSGERWEEGTAVVTAEAAPVTL